MIAQAGEFGRQRARHRRKPPGEPDHGVTHCPASRSLQFDEIHAGIVETLSYHTQETNWLQGGWDGPAAS